VVRKRVGQRMETLIKVLGYIFYVCVIVLLLTMFFIFMGCSYNKTTEITIKGENVRYGLGIAKGDKMSFEFERDVSINPLKGGNDEETE
jgi:hypothetical protein